MNQQETAEKYSAQSMHYLDNAFTSIRAGNAEKAGEFLWGAMAEALKAVAASRERRLEKHWEIGDYATALSKELGDKSIFNAYGHASYLHSNFYEAGLRIEDVAIYAEEIREMVRKLLGLIPSAQSSQGS